jgi:hypothetical protein
MSDLDIAFILTNASEPISDDKIIAASEEMGFPLKRGKENGTFDFEGGWVIAALMPAPHPDAPHMSIAPTSPSREAIAAHRSHVIVTAHSLPGDVRERDMYMAAVTGSVAKAYDAVGAMLGHGVVFHKADLFHDMAQAGLEEDELPAAIAVDITGATEGKDRMSFLTHGMERYGREEIYLTCPSKGKGALGFVFDLVNWMLGDMDHQFPTGDTIGRTAEEKLRIERVPSPAGNPKEVIRLDLPE